MNRQPALVRHVVPAVLAMLIASQFVSRTIAGDINPSAVNRARDFMETSKRGKYIAGYLHFGSSYDGHALIKTCGVTDKAGRTIPGEFALVYQFDWDGTGWTRMAFFFDARGSFQGVRDLKENNATFNKPFVKADLTIAILGNAMIELFRKDMTEEQLRQAQQFIDNADSKGLLEMGLGLQQALGL
jgi:hypothetical protein